jgi:hypothetical protein
MEHQQELVMGLALLVQDPNSSTGWVFPLLSTHARLDRLSVLVKVL